MIDLHFICPQGLNHRRVEESVYESGNWAVSDERADEAVGGRIYLHEKQRERSWHGGTILSWRPFDASRKVFTYRAEGQIRVLCPGGWGQEQATVRR
ncbi:hypothetical protein Q8W71_30020 [Methylobacterium sp. NEAU 140]|uniref:hypothetical protein n=1 Tax=Methylobacterium sp. NEAU 140 TaxID=3064945 RepID=UPI002734FB0C|nr:hypothetical protein [Methylobacterium sp. NEAU 140]MDP4026838.1 hypothetical protein [Methylobacterium sp. NEAU 140]